VPLEQNTVRYLDNFSGGKRGASSAEYFLERGYRVIFLYRKHSLQPFSRHFMIHQEDAFLNFLRVDEEGKVVASLSSDISGRVTHLLETYRKVKKERRLLKVPFTTVTEYLVLLREASRMLDVLGERALVYSAAAVSDFYLPKDKVSAHKVEWKKGFFSFLIEVVFLFFRFNRVKVL